MKGMVPDDKTILHVIFHNRLMYGCRHQKVQLAHSACWFAMLVSYLPNYHMVHSYSGNNYQSR